MYSEADFKEDEIVETRADGMLIYDDQLRAPRDGTVSSGFPHRGNPWYFNQFRRFLIHWLYVWTFILRDDAR